MAKVRSPSYPTIGLREAIEKVRLVYEKDYQNRIGRQLVAKHMGYQSLNGKSLGVLSAVGKFGLLEGRGEEYRVSDLALAIIAHEPKTPQRAQAIAEAAARPELFSELDNRFPGGKASDGAIKSYLLTEKFIPSAADTAMRSYRDTKGLVQEEAGNYNPADAPPPEFETPSMMPQSAGTSSSQQKSSAAPSAAFPIVAPGEREYLRGPLSKEVGYRLLVTGEIGPRELGKIIKLLTLQKELIADDDEDNRPGGQPEE